MQTFVKQTQHSIFIWILWQWFELYVYNGTMCSYLEGKKEENGKK